MYCLSKQSTIALHVSWTISHTVDLAIPKRWAILRYSAGVARNHNVTATLRFTDIAVRITVSCQVTLLDNWSQRYVKVSLLIRKFSIQSAGVNVLVTI